MLYFLAASYIPFSILMIIVLCIFEGKKQEVTKKILLCWVLIPICFTFILGIFKAKIQKGEFLQNFGPILLIAFPPEDLWNPLFTTEVKQTKTEYDFTIQHKYVGKHVIDLAYNKLKTLEKPEIELNAKLVIKNRKDEVIFTKKSTAPGAYWGDEKNGLFLIEYNVPEDISDRSELTGTIKLIGNTEEFIKKYGKTTISIRKGSDL